MAAERGGRGFQGMPTPELSKRLMLRATLRAVSPTVIRAAIAGDDFDAQVLAKPVLEALGRSYRKEVYYPGQSRDP